MKIKLLDCTLRDGGYYNNWDFSKDFIDFYLKNISKLPFDYIEIGYVSNNQNDYYGQVRYVDDELLLKCKKYGINTAVMVDVKEIDKNLINKISLIKKNVKLFRFAINYKNFDDSINLIKKLDLPKEKIALNIMYLSNWMNNKSFLKKITEIKDIEYLYLVDSYGSVFPDEVSKVFNFIRNNNKEVKLGFHPHNNIELAFANTLQSLNNGVSIVDSTFYGMGRGAGNLKSELILTYLNQKHDLEIDFESLENLNKTFIKLHDKYKWGVDYPYILSGFLNFPQKEIMYFQNQRYLSLKALVNTVKGGVKEVEFGDKLKPIKITKSRNYLLIGGGESIRIHQHKIIKWLKENDNITLMFVSSKFSNIFDKIKNNKIFCLHGKEANRVVSDEKDLFLVSPNSNSYETELVNKKNTFTYNIKKQYYNNSMLEASLIVLNEVNISKVFCIGFDGYSQNDQLFDKKDLYIENQNILSVYKKKIDIISLTPSLYSDLIKSSIYAQ